MSTKDDGGPAFACASNHGYQGGMSLRDLFAGMAMQSFILRAAIPDDWRHLVAASYETADAMIAEKKKRDD